MSALLVCMWGGMSSAMSALLVCMWGGIDLNNVSASRVHVGWN